MKKLAELNTKFNKASGDLVIMFAVFLIFCLPGTFVGILLSYSDNQNMTAMGRLIFNMSLTGIACSVLPIALIGIVSGVRDVFVGLSPKIR